MPTHLWVAGGSSSVVGVGQSGATCGSRYHHDRACGWSGKGRLEEAQEALVAEGEEGCCGGGGKHTEAPPEVCHEETKSRAADADASLRYTKRIRTSSSGVDAGLST